MKRRKNVLVLLTWTMLSLVGCSGLHFSKVAYDADLSIEKKTGELLAKASESYNSHAPEVEALKNEIADAIDKEKRRKVNKATIAMWGEVTNPAAKGSLYNLFELWKANDKLSPAMVIEGSRQAQRLLSSISDLENHKIKK